MFSSLRIWLRFGLILWALIRQLPLITPLLIDWGRGRRGSVINSELGAQLAKLLELLGPTFIKIGQTLGSRQDLAPDEFLRPLRRLQDNVRPMSSRTVQRIIYSAFGNRTSELFDDIEQNPVAAGSIAQVHQARLREGGVKVALKIKRPGVRRTIEADLSLLRIFVKLLSLLPRWRRLPALDALDEVGQSIQLQTDFHLEVCNSVRFVKGLAPISGVIVPKTIQSLCTDDVIVMEFIDNLCRLDELHLACPQRECAVATALDCLYRMIFTLGFIHCDLHMGNLMINNIGDVVLLDFGLVAEFDSRRRGIFLDFFLAIVFNDGRQAARILIETGSVVGNDFNEEKFCAEISSLVDGVSRRKAHEFQVSEFAVALFEIQRRHGLRGSTDFMMAILSLLVFEAVAKQLHPYLDFQRQVVPFLATALSRRVGFSDS